MGKAAQRVILITTAVLIIFVSLKVLLGEADSLDRLLVLLTVVVFFGDQLTR